ncbi:MAG: hypothetical protein WBA93_31155 [Microcoleaceae cyanobacterium]
MLENIKDSVVTDSDFLSLISSEIDTIQNFFREEKLENMPPILQILDTNKSHQILPIGENADFNNSTERRQVLKRFGSEFYANWGYPVFPAVVMLTSEAWIKSFDSTSVPDKVRQPSDYPDAIDTIVIQAITLTKPSKEEDEAEPRVCLGVLKIKQREPHILLEELVEPSIMPASSNTTDLLNHFYLGWMQQHQIEQN